MTSPSSNMYIGLTIPKLSLRSYKRPSTCYSSWYPRIIDVYQITSRHLFQISTGRDLASAMHAAVYDVLRVGHYMSLVSPGYNWSVIATDWTSIGPSRTVTSKPWCGCRIILCWTSSSLISWLGYLFVCSPSSWKTTLIRKLRKWSSNRVTSWA